MRLCTMVTPTKGAFLTFAAILKNGSFENIDRFTAVLATWKVSFEKTPSTIFKIMKELNLS